MNIYCFSGLGADYRAFQFIDFAEHNVIHVPWIDPVSNETLESYANRLGDIISTNEPFVLIGLSFGGMLALEISKTKKPHQLILISSIVAHSEKPARMKIAGKLKLYQFVPKKYFTRPNRIAYSLFGTKTAQEKELLDQILKDSDPDFIRWALNSISQWKNKEKLACKRIHGTDDRIFPIKNLSIDVAIEGGGHLMVVSHSKEVGKAILEFIIERRLLP